MSEVQRACRWCKEKKPESEFSKSEWKYAEQHKQARCRRCRRFDDFLRKYKLTRAKYNALLEAQKNACALCEKPFEDDTKIHIDHWHDNRKRVRGLLCPACNTGIGKMGDTAVGCLRAAHYLLKAMCGEGTAEEITQLDLFKKVVVGSIETLKTA
jgi:hypothetical protein